MNINFYNLWFVPTGNRTWAYYFSSRRSVYWTTDRLTYVYPGSSAHHRSSTWQPVDPTHLFEELGSSKSYILVIFALIFAQTLCFPCRRFLGKGVDDNSIERLLVPENIPRNEDIIKFANRLLQQNAKR